VARILVVEDHEVDIGLPGLSGWEVAKRLREVFGRRIDRRPVDGVIADGNRASQSPFLKVARSPRDAEA
jgi:CheY-like chemotaxis protein